MKMQNSGSKMSAEAVPLLAPGPGFVIVTNRNVEVYARRFDGELYTFPPNEPVTIPESAAAYLFAYGMTDADRQRIVIRNGWQKNGMPGDALGPDGAMKRLKNFVFKKGPEPKAHEKPAKKVLPGQQARVPTGINAISEHAKDDGRTILPRDVVRIPGQPGPLAPPAPSV